MTFGKYSKQEKVVGQNPAAENDINWEGACGDCWSHNGLSDPRATSIASAQVSVVENSSPVAKMNQRCNRTNANV